MLQKRCPGEGGRAMFYHLQMIYIVHTGPITEAQIVRHFVCMGVSYERFVHRYTPTIRLIVSKSNSLYTSKNLV